MKEIKDKLILILCLIIFMMYLYITMLIYRVKMVDEILLQAIKTNQEMCYQAYNAIHNLGQEMRGELDEN